jgi:hypothetical protein
MEWLAVPSTLLTHSTVKLLAQDNRNLKRAVSVVCPDTWVNPGGIPSPGV